MEHQIKYNGKQYAVRNITINIDNVPFGVLIGHEQLMFDMLDSDGLTFIGPTEEVIDSSIYYYATPEEMALSDEDLQKFLESATDTEYRIEKD